MYVRYACMLCMRVMYVCMLWRMLVKIIMLCLYETLRMNVCNATYDVYVCAVLYVCMMFKYVMYVCFVCAYVKYVRYVRMLCTRA